ncbi:MAG TPA: hypothetical protein VKE70_28075 [Candidatus Solibacter sp.]|nr:hypothetical protein [Candidatus Solibacter sp.]
MPATQTSSLTLPASVLRTAKRLAQREKRPVSDVVADALNQYEASRPVGVPQTPEEWARFIEECKKHPMSQEELKAETKYLQKVGAASAKRLGIKSDRDVFRICDEFRASRRNAASRTRH